MGNSDLDERDPLKARIYAPLARRYLAAAPVWVDIDDLMQDARVATLEGRNSACGIIDGLRRSKRFVRARQSKTLNQKRGWEVSLEEEPLSSLPAPLSPEREIFLPKLLAQLSNKQRRYLRLAMQDLTNHEIADALGISHAATCRMWNRILRRLQELTADERTF